MISDKKYVMGVDGGNTKTDYLLFDSDGNKIDTLRAGTCSHENFDNSFIGAELEMGLQITNLLERNQLTIKDIHGAAFGLAGVDYKSQQQKMIELLTRLGFKNFVAVNDSFLGIKGVCPKGYGISSINGTGTVAGGVDKNGNTIQVSGVGYISGDEAGGSNIATKTLRAVYDSIFRCADETSMRDEIFTLFGVTDIHEFIENVVKKFRSHVNALDVLTILYKHANNGDKVAITVLKNVAVELARSAAGCIRLLDFSGDESVDVAIAGSVWVKPDAPFVIEAFKNEIEKLSCKKCNVIKMTAPPAAGAVIWAIELLGEPFDYLAMRKKITDALV